MKQLSTQKQSTRRKLRNFGPLMLPPRVLLGLCLLTALQVSGCKRQHKNSQPSAPSSATSSTQSSQAVSSKYVDPMAPIVVVLDSVETTILNLKSIAENLVKGTMAEMFLQQWMSGIPASPLFTAFKDAGLALTKRIEFWVSSDAQFVDILLPVSDRGKLRKGIASLISLLGPEGAKKASKPEKREILVPDEANKKEKGDMFWHLSTDSAVSRIGCHYYAEGMERCSLAVSGNGVNDAAFQTWWGKVHSSASSKQKLPGFSRSVKNGFQIRFDVADEQVRKNVFDALKKTAVGTSELKELRDLLSEYTNGEYWAEVSPTALHFGNQRDDLKRSTNVASSEDVGGHPGVNKGIASRLLKGAMVRFAGVLPKKAVVQQFLERSKRRSSSATKELREDLASLLKHGEPLVSSLLGRSIAGFIHLDVSNFDSGKEALEMNSIGKRVPFGVIGHVPESLSDTDIDKSLSSLIKAGNSGIKKNKQRLKGKLKSGAGVLSLSRLSKSTGLPGGIASGWSIKMDKEEFARLYRKGGEMVVSLSQSVANFLSGLETKKLIAASKTDSDAWIDHCAHAVSSNLKCSGLIEVRNLSLIATVVKKMAEGQSAMIASQVEMVLMRIEMLEFGFARSNTLSNGVGQLKFSFE